MIIALLSLDIDLFLPIVSNRFGAVAQSGRALESHSADDDISNFPSDIELAEYTDED